MDSVPQQDTAIIREGETQQPCPKNPEAKVADSANTNADTAKHVSKDLDTKAKKKRAGAQLSDGGRTNKGGKKKRKPIPPDDTSDSDEDIDGTVETEPKKMVLRKRDDPAKKVPRKVWDAQHLKTQQVQKNDSRKLNTSRTEADKTLKSDVSESDWDSSSSQDEQDEADDTPATTNKSKDSSLNQDISTQVARELQHILHLAQAPSADHQSLGAGLGGGPDPRLGLSALNYPQGLSGLSGYAGLRGLASRHGCSDDNQFVARGWRGASRHTEQQRSGDYTGGKSAKENDFKRVDQVWDSVTHMFKLQATAETNSEAKYNGFCFHVRRTFDWEGKYKTTVVDIKSKALRQCLQEVIGNITGISLVDETPKLDPNVLFLYLEDLRTHYKTLKTELTALTGSKKERKEMAVHIEEKRKHLKILIKYLDKDYAKIKASLSPMLEHGLITFELLWALWKPNTLVYTSTYGSHDEPRVFKVDTAEKHNHMSKGKFYQVEGKYFEYDGKNFGYGSFVEDIPEFRGAKKITSLNCYPLKYHRDEAQVRSDLIQRGKKFVTLSGVSYKSHHGMAYYKKKKSVVKVNVNGRIIVDAAIHRRINPNYPISRVRPKEDDTLGLGDDEGSDEGSDENPDEDSDEHSPDRQPVEAEVKPVYVFKQHIDDSGRLRHDNVTKEEAGEFGKHKEKLAKVESRTEDTAQASVAGDSESRRVKTLPEFTEEEYLIASSVVLGFSFGEKQWLEFTVSGIKDVSWNDHAYDSLVLEPKIKETVKALVESHKYHAPESIDDVIQGKGKGLVVVLHGPPGTGKTLTAEGISDLLKCPLYMVSAGELGTNSRILETELQRILDICHSWGAILLLDEADVFLEKRNIADIHRNALVSVFLRQLEYFQGILFLTTNRVETFDDAFQSRIHIALRYDALDLRAKKAIFKMFVERTRDQQKTDKNSISFSEADYDSLARHELNGRQIKNTVIRAQALAVTKREPLSMVHIKQILDVQIDFQKDLKGGTGYQDAMRSYF